MVENKCETSDVAFLPEPPLNTTFKLDNIMWTTKQEIKFIRRFPDHLQLDATAKTNRRNLPFIFLVGMDSNKLTILWGSSIFGKGELTKNFRWLIDVALYNIYGKFIMSAVALTVTDGDKKIFEPVEEAIKCGKLGGKRASCFWHEVTRYYTIKIQPGADEDEKTNIHLPVRRALNDFRLNTESECEIKEIFTKIRAHLLSCSELYPSAATRIQLATEFVTKVEAHASTLAYYYLSARVYGGGTTGRNEGENSACKSAVTVNSKTQLQNLYTAEDTRRKNRTQQREIQQEKFSLRVPSLKNDDSNRDRRRQLIAECLEGVKVQPNVWKMLQERLRISSKLIVRDCSTEGTCTKFTVTSTIPSSNTYNDGGTRLWMKPQRTRYLTVDQTESGLILRCSCPSMEHDQMPCSCQLAVTKGRFPLSALHVRYYMAYNNGALDDMILSHGNHVHPATILLDGFDVKGFDLSHPREDSGQNGPGTLPEPSLVDIDHVSLFDSTPSNDDDVEQFVGNYNYCIISANDWSFT